MGEEGYSLSGRVFHTIRENILSGKYKCDEELKEKTLGDELGVSRTPVREALRQLELEENIFLVEFHAKKENYAQILELDNKFHEVLYEASGSKMLKHELSAFHHYVERVRKITLSMPDRVVKSNDEHKKIVEALKQHNAKEAELLATSHMLNTIENMDNYGWDNLLK